MAYLPPLNGGRLNASITGNTAGVPALISTGNMVLAGGNNVTLSQNGSTITINASAGGGAGSNTFGAGTAGNVSGNTGYISGSNLQMAFYGGNNITLNQSITSNSATITVSGPSFSNANNVSLGISNNGVVTGSASFNQTIQSASNIQGIGAGASTAYTGNITFSSANNISFGLSNNIMTASAAVPTASVAFSAGGSSASLASLTFANSNGVNFGLNAGVITASYTGGGGAAISAAGASASNGTVVFSNANNVNFGMAGSAVTASASFSQTLQTSNNIQALVGANATSTASTGTVTFGNANNMVFGMSNNVMTASAAVPTASIGVSAGTTTGNLASMTFSNANGINFGLNAGVVTASYTGGGGGLTLTAPGSSFSSGSVNFNASSGAITIAGAGNSINFAVPATSSMTATNITISSSGSTIGIVGAQMFDAAMISGGNGGTLGSTYTSQNTNGLYFAAGSNVTLSQATNTNGVTMSINAGGGGAPTLSRWEYPEAAFGPLTTVPQGSVSFQHVYMPFNVVASAMKIGGNMSVGTATVATTGTISVSLWMGIYTLNGSTLSNLLATSGNNSFVVSNSASTSANYTNYTGMRQFTVSMAQTTLTAGEYWIAAAMSTSTNYASNTMSFMLYGNSLYPSAAGAGVLTPMGTNTSNARDVLLGQGIYPGTVSSGPTTLAISTINNTSASNVMRAAFYHAIYNATY